MRQLLLATLLTCATTLAAQTAYFQQEVNYKINVTLDDTKHTLTGDIEWEYTNHSGQTLTEMWIHLWPNAFKNRNTAFCRQKLRQHSAAFYFAPDSSLGYIKGLDFTVNGQKATWKLQPNNPDIAVLTLAQPLAPGGSVRVATPFVEKIPASYSRLGHVGTSYQVTQWFPKPAVYDNAGWHPIPYLNQGEFYSEFGTFDVQITLPSNYVVGATGSLETASEVAFLQQKEQETRAELAKRQAADQAATGEKKPKAKKPTGQGADDPFPASSTTTKTLRYHAERVHDFAWFADKRFFVLKDTARLASGRTVDCWAMFTKSDFKHWQKGAFYVKRAIESYSGWVGEYPWPQATAVHSALSAGGGMEYPMITVIGDARTDASLDEVITHEVGHNWFYGLLASNERDHPWMDEGMNSYYEQRYMRQFYNKGTIETQIPAKIFDPKKYGGLLENGLLLLARNGFDQTADQNSDQMTSIAYGLQAYMKTAHCFRWFENAVGTARFDAAMQDYYRRWSFKHPQPADFANSLKESGLEADWLLQLMQTRERSDPALRSAKRQSDGSWSLKVKQRGQVKAPFAVTALKNGEPVQSIWVTSKEPLVQFPAVDADAFVLDNEHLTLDVQRKNNQVRTHGVLRSVEPLSVKLLAPFQNPKRTTLGVLPWVGFNNYDKMQVGLLLYNPPAPGNRLQYYLAPGFGLGSKELVGGGDVRWRIHPTSGGIKRWTLGVEGRSFNEEQLTRSEITYNTRFQRVTPFLKVDFRSKNTAVRQSVALRWNFIGQQVGVLDTLAGEQFAIRKEWVRTQIQELRYELANSGFPNPWGLAVSLEHQQWDDADVSKSYLRAGVEWKQAYYYQPKRKINLRVYGGYFLQNSSRDRKALGFGATDPFARGSLSLAQNGYTDYKYDYIFLARNSQSGLLGRQVNLSEGGFKYSFGSAEALNAGHSNSYIFAINLSADLPKRLPGKLPLRPYFDAGVADLGFVPAGGDEPSQLFWSGGFALEFFKGNLNVYFPAVSSKNISEAYKRTSGGNSFGDYLRRITWSVKLNGWEPLSTADRFIF